MIDQLAAVLGTKKLILIAGLVGAIISLRFISEVRVENGLSFAIGLFGMSMVAAILAALKEGKLGEAVASWFKRPGG